MNNINKDKEWNPPLEEPEDISNYDFTCKNNNVNFIKEDYENFNLNYKFKGQKSFKKPESKYNYVNKIRECNFQTLFKIKSVKKWNDSNYSSRYPIYDSLLNLIITDLETYEMFLFINCLQNHAEAVGMLDIDDDDNEIFYPEKIKEYYENIFKPYFINKYEENKESPDSMKMKIFDETYDNIFRSDCKMIKNPSTQEDLDNNKLYAREASHKYMLKKEYKKFLHGEDIRNLKNKYQIQMMIYILDSVIS